MDSVGEGEGGKIWENGIETCVISCMKRKKKKRIVKILNEIQKKKKSNGTSDTFVDTVLI